jgi:hypothetical protein
MSRRSHHPARRHVRSHAEPRPPRPAASTEAAASESAGAPAAGTSPAKAPVPTPVPAPVLERSPATVAVASDVPGPEPVPGELPAAEPVPIAPGAVETVPVDSDAAGTAVPAPVAANRPPSIQARAVAMRMPSRPAPQPATQNGAGETERNACTAPQLRRFIKSRAYVPMHELRRRFGIEGQDDDVTGVDMGGAHVYVGLPEREGLLLGELLRARDVGYELSLDPISPIVVGVFPMRPIPRS